MCRIVNYERGILDFHYIDEISSKIDMEIVTKSRSVSDIIFDSFKDANKVLNKLIKLLVNKLYRDLKYKESEKNEAGVIASLHQAYKIIPQFITHSIKYLGLVDRHGMNQQLCRVEEKCYNLIPDWVNFANYCFENDSEKPHQNLETAFNAIEYCMHYTTSDHMPRISNDQFGRMTYAVSHCMTAFIYHIDLYGIKYRTKMLAQTEEVAGTTFTEVPLVADHTNTGPLLSHEIVSQVVTDRRAEKVLELERNLAVKYRESQLFGNVVGSIDTFDQMIGELSSQSRNIPLRWSLGKFVGGGSVGSVYIGLNLETGGYESFIYHNQRIIAVKQIIFQSLRSYEDVRKSILDEMNVFKLLKHHNVIEYYGTEVYRFIL